MRRAPLVASALLLAFGLGGCKKHVDTPTPEAPSNGQVASAPGVAPPASSMPGTPLPTKPDPANVPPPADPAPPVSEIELGSAIGGDNQISTPATTFGPHDTLHATVTTSVPSGQLETRWSFQDGSVVHTETKTLTEGPMQHEFHISKPDGWPVGHYRLDVLLDGQVTQSKEFDVR